MKFQENVSARSGIKPQVALSRFTFDLRIEHLDRRLVDLQVTARFKFLPDQPVNGQEQVGYFLHPLHHLLPGDKRSKALQKIAFQIVVAQMVVKAAE